MSPPDPPSSATLPSTSRVLPFVFLTVFLDLVGFGIIIPLMPFYVRSMGGGAQTVGWILASFSATQLVATPVLGRLSDRYGRRPVILLSLLGNAISMAVFALAARAQVLPLLFASRIVAGATAGNLAACQAAIADVTTGENRARGMGQLGAGIALGLVLGPMLGSTLSELGPSAPPLAAAALALLDVVGAAILMPETRRVARPSRDAHQAGVEPAAAPARPALFAVLATRSMGLVLGLYFLTFLAMTNLQVALALLAQARLHWGAREVGRLFGLQGGVSLVVQAVLVGRIVRALGQERSVVAGGAFLCTGMTCVALAWHPPVLIIGVALIAVGLGIQNPVMSSLASASAGRETQGAALGVAQSMGGLARSVGPLLSGYLFAHVSSGAPFLGGALAAGGCIALGIALAAQARVRHPGAAEPDG